MINQKNQHVSPKDGGWIVKREGTKKTFKFFEDKQEAMKYANAITLNNGGSIITHKYNGQFKSFKHGNEIYVKKHKIDSRGTKTIQIIHPIINNLEPIIETNTSI